VVEVAGMAEATPEEVLVVEVQAMSIIAALHPTILRDVC